MTISLYSRAIFWMQCVHNQRLRILISLLFCCCIICLFYFILFCFSYHYWIFNNNKLFKALLCTSRISTRCSVICPFHNFYFPSIIIVCVLLWTNYKNNFINENYEEKNEKKTLMCDIGDDAATAHCGYTSNQVLKRLRFTENRWFMHVYATAITIHYNTNSKKKQKQQFICALQCKSIYCVCELTTNQPQKKCPFTH